MDKFMKKVGTSPRAMKKRWMGGSGNGGSNAEHQPHKCFGVSLPSLLKQECDNGCASPEDIPLVVQRICDFIVRHGLQHEGIFRINGNSKTIEHLRQLFENQETFESVHPQRDMFAMADLLKLYLRELPEGIISEERTSSFLKACELLPPADASGLSHPPLGSSSKEYAQQLSTATEVIHSLIRSLPSPEYTLLKYLCRFLSIITEQEEINKMSPLSLGIVFGPNVFRCGQDFQALRNQGSTNRLIAFFIENCDVLFNMEAPSVSQCSGNNSSMVLRRQVPSSTDKKVPSAVTSHTLGVSQRRASNPPSTSVSTTRSNSNNSSLNPSDNISFSSKESIIRKSLPYVPSCTSNVALVRSLGTDVDEEDDTEEFSDESSSTLENAGKVNKNGISLNKNTTSMKNSQDIVLTEPQPVTKSRRVVSSGKETGPTSSFSKQNSNNNNSNNIHIQSPAYPLVPQSMNSTYETNLNVSPQHMLSVNTPESLHSESNTFHSPRMNNEISRHLNEIIRSVIEEQCFPSLSNDRLVVSRQDSKAQWPFLIPLATSAALLLPADLSDGAFHANTSATNPSKEIKSRPDDKLKPGRSLEEEQPLSVEKSRKKITQTANEPSTSNSKWTPGKPEIPLLNLHDLDGEISHLESRGEHVSDQMPGFTRSRSCTDEKLASTLPNSRSNDDTTDFSRRVSTSTLGQDELKMLEGRLHSTTMELCLLESYFEKRHGRKPTPEERLQHPEMRECLDEVKSIRLRIQNLESSTHVTSTEPSDRRMKRNQHRFRSASESSDQSSSYEENSPMPTEEREARPLSSTLPSRRTPHEIRSTSNKCYTPTHHRYSHKPDRHEDPNTNLTTAWTSQPSTPGEGKITPDQRSCRTPTVDDPHASSSSASLSAESTFKMLAAKLQEKRRAANRPDDLNKMTTEQISAEKVDIQKCLLHYEGIHGRPQTREERLLMKPLYDRYRQVKRIIHSPETTSLPLKSTSRDSSNTRAGDAANFGVIHRIPTADTIDDPEFDVMLDMDNTLRYGSLQFDQVGRGSAERKRREESEVFHEKFEQDKPSSSVIVIPSKGQSQRTMKQSSQRGTTFTHSKPSTPTHSAAVPATPEPSMTTAKLLDDTENEYFDSHRLTENLEEMSLEELLTIVVPLRSEKKKLQRSLKLFEYEFLAASGHRVEKSDRTPMRSEYNQYKQLKQKLRLAENLIQRRQDHP